jgi:ribosomal protein S18 acetylase RimI-like enzyme
MIDVVAMRQLLLHEARVHAIPGRDLRDLGDAILLHDPVESEPFWNRLEGLRWPDDPGAFDRRLTETFVLFASLGRSPHIWASPLHDAPTDLVARLKANGFRDLGSSHLMLLDQAVPTDPAGRVPPMGVTIERSTMVDRVSVDGAAAAIVEVLLDAFDVGSDRRSGIEAETASSLAHPWFTHYLVRADGRPASVARRATFEGASYLSSIGTARWARGRGLGSLVTRTAVADAVAAGSRWTYLGVFADNAVAIGVYERAGFRRLGGPAPDLLLVG